MSTKPDDAGELSRADIVGLILHGIADPTALVTVVRGLNDDQLRAALYETFATVGALVRADDRFRAETSRLLAEVPEDLEDDEEALIVAGLLVDRLRWDLPVRRALLGLTSVAPPR